MSEFDLIRRHWQSCAPTRRDVILGVGDDCALLQPRSGYQIATSVDTLISGVHFPHETSAHAIGHKSLAVNLSDLAAMGAEPAWATLAISMPEVDEHWVAEFTRGFAALAHTHNVALIGGDTTRGALSITVQVMGYVAPGKALCRQSARVGDVVCVSGVLGHAAYGLACLMSGTSDEQTLPFVRQLNYPQPRLDVSAQVKPYAHACIDVSDGLVSDLGHICHASGVGMRLEQSALPIRDLLAHNTLEQSLRYALQGGDDYQLAFTAPQSALSSLASCADISIVGEVVEDQGITLIDDTGQSHPISVAGFDHFKVNE